MLLQILHGNLKHKDRVLTKKRVTGVELTTNGVRALTQDGSVYEGDIVVGADGIHSAVRDEMWRLGKEQSPGYFPEDENSCMHHRTYRRLLTDIVTQVSQSRLGAFLESRIGPLVTAAGASRW